MCVRAGVFILCVRGMTHFATVAPIPLLAPVTMMTFPSSLPMSKCVAVCVCARELKDRRQIRSVFLGARASSSSAPPSSTFRTFWSLFQVVPLASLRGVTSLRALIVEAVPF